MAALVRPPGVTLISLFFVFGATMSGLTAVLLAFAGSPLDVLWRINPRAHAGFAALPRGIAVLVMATVCAVCAFAAIQIWRCRGAGYWAALAILTVNLCGDTINVFVEHDWRTLIGLPIAGAMIAYLVRRRRLFSA